MNTNKLTLSIKDLHIQNKNAKQVIIQKALDSSFTMLHLDEFVKRTGFKINEILPLDMMWNAFHRDIPIYITNDLISIFGYKGETFTQKQALMKLVKKYDIPIIQMTNKEYKVFLQEEKNDEFNLVDFYPEITTTEQKNKLLHTLIMPRDFKKLMLVVNTEKGNLAREYVIVLDELFHLYTLYQKEHEKTLRERLEKSHHELMAEFEKVNKMMSIQNTLIERQTETIVSQSEIMTRQNETLEDMKLDMKDQTEILDEMNEKLNTATDERAPKTKNPNKHGMFHLIQLNSPDSRWDYYVIRGQKLSVSNSLNTLKTKHPRYEIKLTIEYQPNAINLFNLIKEELRGKRRVIRVTGNQIRLTKGYTGEMLIQDIEEINDIRRDV
jgi:hypothetical protein